MYTECILELYTILCTLYINNAIVHADIGYTQGKEGFCVTYFSLTIINCSSLSELLEISWLAKITDVLYNYELIILFMSLSELLEISWLAKITDVLYNYELIILFMHLLFN